MCVAVVQCSAVGLLLLCAYSGQPRWARPSAESHTHLCLCRSSTYWSCWYSLAAMQSTVCSTVRRDPSLMVPPLCVVEPAGGAGARRSVQDAGLGEEGRLAAHCRRAVCLNQRPAGHCGQPAGSLGSPSGMKTTTGCGVAGSNSVLLASVQPSTLRANSITAICSRKARTSAPQATPVGGRF